MLRVPHASPVLRRVRFRPFSIFSFPFSPILVLVLAANTIGAAQVRQPPASASSGRKIFATTCASCHGLDARGGERAPNILARPEVRNMTDADISRVIREGTPSQRMPAFGDTLDPAAVRDVASYLHTLLHGGARPVRLPGDPASGKSLFFGKAGCSECHMVAGAGGFLGADLSAYAASHGIDEIRDAITNPNSDSVRRQKTATVVTRDGAQFTGIVRNEDNFSLQLQTPDGAFHLLAKSDLTRFDDSPQSLMPADYAQRLSPQEMNDILSFLMRAAETNAKSQPHPAKGSQE